MTAPRGKLCAFMLVASLALNLFLGSVFATRWVRHPAPGFQPNAFSMFRMRRVLGPDAAPTFDKVWAQHDVELKARMHDAAQARERATRALEADPFDAAKAAAALADFRAKAALVQESMHGAVVELAADLTPEQRHRLAEALDRSGPGAMGGRRRHEPRTEPPGSPEGPDELPAREAPPQQPPPASSP